MEPFFGFHGIVPGLVYCVRVLAQIVEAGAAAAPATTVGATRPAWSTHAAPSFCHGTAAATAAAELPCSTAAEFFW